MLRYFLLFLGLILNQTSNAVDQDIEQDVDLFGPVTFTRFGAQAPKNQIANFSIDLATVSGPFRITVINGGPNGEKRASSAKILLNGKRVFGPSDFNKNVSILEQTVEVGMNNLIEVNLASAPESFLIIRVIGKSVQTLPSIGFTQALPKFITPNTPSELTVTSIITNQDVIATSITLERINDDESVTILGTMHDDGLNGDLALGDRIYTLSTMLYETVPQELKFQVSAAFSDAPQRSKSEIQSVFVRSEIAPTIMLNQLSSELAAGDITAALTHFSGAERHRRLLESLSQDQLNRLATAFKASQQISSEEDMTVFRVPWQNDAGNPITREIMLARDQTGKWLIISW